MEENDIKKLRLGLSLSQERFARLINVSLQTVRRWEEGLTKPLPVISLRLEELQREINAQRGKGEVPMADKKKKPAENIDLGIELGLGGLFKGLGGLFDLVSKMAEEGKQEQSQTGETEVLGGKGKAVYGFSVRMGLGGKPVIEQFGNIQATEKGAVVAEVREPLVDVLDEGERLLVIAELPGVQAKDIQVKIKEDILELTAESGDRKYSKEVLLPSPVDASTMEQSYKNGILEIKLVKKK